MKWDPVKFSVACICATIIVLGFTYCTSAGIEAKYSMCPR